MDYSEFYIWLTEERKMSVRAAKDVISRCKRVCKYLETEEITSASLEQLNQNSAFVEQSMFIKSQLRRAVALWNMYGERDG